MQRSTVVLASVASGIAAATLHRKRLSRAHVCADLATDVTIDRDSYGIPHIAAGTQRDAMLGMGWALAEDRLWQMDLLRRTALGRLSEVAGEATLESDRFMRLLGIQEVAFRLVEAASSDAREMLDGFADGVNLRMQRAMLPLEFRVLRYRPEPWTPRDSLAVLRLMGWSLSGFHHNDLVAEQLSELIGSEWTEAIFAGRMAESALVVREPSRPLSEEGITTGPTRVLPRNGGSNAWAVAGERTVGGKPLLASDPHLGYTNPSVWAEASIDAPGLRVAGVTMPGVPAILIGRTPTFAWGLTAAMLSQSFLYRETLSADGTAVDDAAGPIPLVTRLETIGVKGREPEVLRVRSTPRGPLFSDVEAEWSSDPISLYWTGMESSQDYDALLHLNRATSVADAVAVRGLVAAPTLNMAAADDVGEIASLTIGRIADRDQRAGLLDPSAFPPRYIPADELPLERNPERGWIASANNRITGWDYGYALHGFYEPGFRIQRISDELDSRSRHSSADMRALQLDICSLHAAELVPVLVRLCGDTLPDWAGRDLEEWDYVTTTDSRATLLFESFYRAWVARSLRHRLPEPFVARLISLLGVGDVPMGFCDRLLKGEVVGWFSDVTIEAEAEHALRAGLEWIEAKLGPDHAGWTWGAVHTVTFAHPFGQLPGKHQRLVNVGPFPVPGDRTTVWPSGGDANAPFTISGGPSMRFVTDLRGPELAWMTNTLGQTGLPLTRHYRDQVRDFLEGRLHPIWTPARRRSTTLIARDGGR